LIGSQYGQIFLEVRVRFIKSATANSTLGLICSKLLKKL
jgi:hypothetical protein